MIFELWKSKHDGFYTFINKQEYSYGEYSFMIKDCILIKNFEAEDEEKANLQKEIYLSGIKKPTSMYISEHDFFC